MTTTPTTPATPSTPTTPTTPTDQRPWITGAVLIGLGLLLLAGQLFEQNDWLILGGLSALCIAVYVATRKPGWMIPAMILAGLAIGLGLEDYGYSTNGSAVVLGLAAGFIAIYVFNTFTGAAASWWPLIPGLILAIVGGAQAIGGTEAAETVGRLWPIALILVGILVLFGSRQQLTKRPKT